MSSPCFTFIFSCLIIVSFGLPWDCPTNTSICLAGEKHKTEWSPEDDSYAACTNYKDASCCTANFTQQLATSDVGFIVDDTGIFNWSHCGDISQECEAYLIEIECFYRCSPNMIFFAGDFPSSLDRVPLCSAFCDDWYDVCKNESTCVTNWIFDWVYDNVTGINECPENSNCSSYEKRYSTGKNLCNIMWGNSFNYTTDTSRCLTPGSYSTNTEVVEFMFYESGECADPNNNGIKWDCPTNNSLCLIGDKHKVVFGPETNDSYSSVCGIYKDNSCCTTDFTLQLSKSNVGYIVDDTGIFNWSHCGDISQQCEAFLLDIECFYRCSPNMIYFGGDFPSSLNRVPLCSGFCDNWYDACKNDLTCVSNWIFDWEYHPETGVNECPVSSQCLSFEERYTNSENLCSIMWGNSFNYTDNDECLYPGKLKTNSEMVEQMFYTSNACEGSIDLDISSLSDEKSNKNNKNNDNLEAWAIALIVLSIGIVLGVIGYYLYSKSNKGTAYIQPKKDESPSKSPNANLNRLDSISQGPETELGGV